MKKFLAALIFFLALTNFSEASDDLDAAQIRLACAICSMGAYSDDESYLLTSMLHERGWTIEKISRKNNRAEAKAYLVSKDDVKILAVAGAENIKDVEANFRLGRVNLHDDTPLAPYEKKVNDKFFVHRGFRDYADEILSDGAADRLKNSLEKNPREILYLTGHNLNGAVVAVMAIRLADSGVEKNRLKVITFGAPPVSSRVAAKNYSDKIDLTRVTVRGDAIKRSLQVLGYAHFGKVLKYRQASSSAGDSQKMSVYLDCALRDFFNEGGSLRYETKNKIDTPIYVAPIILVKKELKSDDEKIILNALDDFLRNNFSNLTFSDVQSVKLKEKNISDASFDEFVAAGKNFGCKYILVRILRAKKIRDARSGDKLVTLEEIFLNTNGIPVSMQTSGTSTEELTIFEAALATQEKISLRSVFREDEL